MDLEGVALCTVTDVLERLDKNTHRILLSAKILIILIASRLLDPGGLIGKIRNVAVCSTAAEVRLVSRRLHAGPLQDSVSGCTGERV